MPHDGALTYGLINKLAVVVYQLRLPHLPIRRNDNIGIRLTIDASGWRLTVDAASKAAIPTNRLAAWAKISSDPFDFKW